MSCWKHYRFLTPPLSLILNESWSFSRIKLMNESGFYAYLFGLQWSFLCEKELSKGNFSSEISSLGSLLLSRVTAKTWIDFKSSTNLQVQNLSSCPWDSKGHPIKMGKHTELWFICKGQPLKQWYFPVFHRCMYKNPFEQNYKWNYKFLDIVWKKSAVTCLHSYYTDRHIPHLHRSPSSPPYLLT